MKTTKLSLTLAASAALALSACTNPATLGDPENANTNAGLGAGAVVGAIVGSAVAGSGSRTQGAILGGIVGAAAGGIVGNQLDKQAAELNASLDDNILVETADGRMIVTLPEDITFDTDSAVVRPSLQAELNKVAASLVQYPDSTVQIIGHTDNQGDAGYNQRLSEQRASSVSAILQGGGVTSGRISTLGKGENEPKASNLTPEGMAQNRRVEIVVIPTST